MSKQDVIDHIRKVCAGIAPMPDDASYVHQAMMTALHASGYRVLHEYPVQLSSGRGGRIDIVVQSPCGRWAAIEIDARKPRKKSIAKMATRNWVRICCLRGVEEGEYDYPGLDAVIALPVRLASFAEKAKKASVAVTGRSLRALS